MAAPVEVSMLDAIVQLIQTVGFPIFVAGWFMFRMEKKLDENREALGSLKSAVYESLGKKRTP